MNFKLCTVGCGYIANACHGPAQRLYASQQPGITLAGCCDLDAGRSAAYRENFGFARGYVSVERMLEEERPDAVCLILPPERIVEVALPLLRAGLPLFLEKPPALDSRQLEELISAWQPEVPAQVGFNRRYMPLMSRARALLEEHTLPGEGLQVNYEMIRYNRTDADFSTTAVHAFDAAGFLARSPYRSARFTYRDATLQGRKTRAAAMTATCQSGAQIRVNIQPRAGATLERATLHAPDLTMTVDLPIWGAHDTPGQLRLWKADRLIVDLRGDADPSPGQIHSGGFQAEVNAFLASARTGKPAAPTLEDARPSVRLMEAFRQREESVHFTAPTLVPVG
jgi:myo-inositol 2-dehydrogenase/D-chiro-inositol 1-dehydrogenase